MITELLRDAFQLMQTDDRVISLAQSPPIYKFNKVLLDCYVRLIAIVLQERFFKLRIDHTVSSKRHITAGVPHGNFLGLLLFLASLRFSAHDEHTRKLPENALRCNNTYLLTLSILLLDYLLTLMCCR